MNEMIMALSHLVVTFLTLLLIPLMILVFVLCLLVLLINCYKLHRMALFAEQFQHDIHSFFTKARQGFCQRHEFHFVLQYITALSRDKFFFGKADKVLEVFQSKEDTRQFADDYAKQRQIMEVTENMMLEKDPEKSKQVSLLDDVLSVHTGIDQLIHDIVLEMRQEYLFPNFELILKRCFANNRYLNRTFYWLPVHFSSFMITSFPALFVMSGILGTFVGIQVGMPELSLINPQNIEQTSQSLSRFFENVSFSMNSSIFGILFAIGLIVFGLIYRWIQTERHGELTLKEGLEAMWNHYNQIRESSNNTDPKS